MKGEGVSLPAQTKGEGAAKKRIRATDGERRDSRGHRQGSNLRRTETLDKQKVSQAAEGESVETEGEKRSHVRACEMAESVYLHE